MKVIENLTIKEAKEKLKEYEDLKKVFNIKDEKTVCDSGHFFEIGKNYFIRTVTMHLLGRLVAVGDKELVLEECSWIADNGRFHKFLNGELDSSCEVEPFPEGNVIVGRGAVLDATVWKHKLLREVK